MKVFLTRIRIFFLTSFKAVFWKLSITVMRSIFRKSRPDYLTDETDPYFFIRKELKKHKTNTMFEDKLYLKKNISKIDPEIKFAKLFFTFNRNGKIKSGSIPKNTELVFKHDMGRGGKKVIIMNSDLVTPKKLREIYAKVSFRYDRYDGKWSDADYYSKFQNIAFAEEKLPSSDDYKVFVYKNTYEYCVNKGRFTNRTVGQYDANFKPTTHYAYNTIADKPMDKSDQEIFTMLQEKSRKVFDYFGHFVRVDWYVSEGVATLGEIKFMPTFGAYWRHASVTNEPLKEDVLKTIKLLKDSY